MTPEQKAQHLRELLNNVVIADNRLNMASKGELDWNTELERRRVAVLALVSGAQHCLPDVLDRVAELEAALGGLLGEYNSQKCQFGDSPIWGKYEDKEAVERAQSLVPKEPTDAND